MSDSEMSELTVQDGSQCSDIGLDADVRGPDVLPLHLDACHVVARLCKEFTDLTKREQLTDDLRQCLDGVVDSLKNAIDPKPQTVAVVGQTGSGKSVLLCALIKASLLPSSSVGACTSAITELCYHNELTYKAVINFVSKAEWKRILLLLQGDMLLEPDDDKEETSQEKKVSPASRAKARFDEVYPHLRNESLLSWNVDRLLNESPVGDVLGTGPMVITEANPETLQRKLVECIASNGSKIDQPVLWPLIQSVQIYGKFDVLAPGITLVDLPGQGDANDERDKIGEEYLKKADCILLVADMKRAKDTQGTIDYLRRLLTQILVDGRTTEASVAFVFTNADLLPSDNECPLTDEIQAEVDMHSTIFATAKENIKKFNNIGLKCEKKLERGNMSSKKADKLKAKVERYHDKVRDAAVQQRDARSAKKITLARARTDYVREQMCKRYLQIWHELSDTLPDGLSQTSARSLEIPSLLQYFVGSKDYMSLIDVLPEPASVFKRESETGIPELQTYITQLGERRKLAVAQRVLREAHDFLDHIKASFGSAKSVTNHDTRLQQFQDTAGDKLSQLDVQAQRLISQSMMVIRRHLHDVANSIQMETLKAKAQSVDVFENYHDSVKWNTLRACMRRQGVWTNDDLNTRLTCSIFDGVKITWNNTLNTIIPLAYNQLEQDLLEAITSTLDTISADAPDDLQDSIVACRSLRIASRLQDSYNDIRSCMLSTQRLGSRAPKTVMQDQLSKHYEIVGIQKGGGVFDRMKEMNISYITENGDELFDAIHQDTRETFAKLASDMETKTKKTLTAIMKLLVSVLGIPSEEQLPADNARKRKGSIVKLFVSLLGSSGDEQLPIDNQQRESIMNIAEKFQPAIKSLTDSVGTRLEEIK